MRRRSTGRLAAAVLTAGALVAACGSSGGPAPTASPGPVGGRYVAMGSSFGAGPGLGPDLAPGCGRSARNYPHLVARDLRLDLVDVTCSGATTATVAAQAQGTFPPQIRAVRSDTRLVTITVGGNDLGYAAAIGGCLTATRRGRHCALPTAAQTSRQAAGLRTHLDALIATIRQRAPRALVVLVSYARIFPRPPASCADNPISQADSTALAAVGDTLDRTFHQVVTDTRVRLVDVYRATGHDVCAAASRRWIAGADTAGVVYHPTVTGMAAIAGLVETTVRAGH